MTAAHGSKHNGVTSLTAALKCSHLFKHDSFTFKQSLYDHTLCV